MRQRLVALAFATCLGWLAGAASAASYPGTMTLQVDATDLDRKVFHVNSIGIVVGRMDRIDAVDWGSPAFEAGLTPTGTLLAVNGGAYTADRLKAAITAAKDSPIELLFKAGDRFRTVRIVWRGGLRYPRLERVDGTPDRLGALLHTQTRQRGREASLPRVGEASTGAAHGNKGPGVFTFFHVHMCK